MRAVSSLRLLPLALLLSLVLLPASVSAQAVEESETRRPGSELTLSNLVAVQNLRCDALRRGKAATVQANIYRSEASRVTGALQIKTETQVQQAEASAGAAFEEAGRLKRRVTRMVDDFIAARRLAWYQTVNQARKIQLEQVIHGARAIVEDGCTR